MAKILGTLDPNTIIHQSNLLIETGKVTVAGLGTTLANGNLCTAMWTSNSTGGEVIYKDINGDNKSAHIASTLGYLYVTFTQIVSATGLTGDEIWWGRSANYPTVNTRD